MRAWHSPNTGCLHIAISKRIPSWFKLTVFAAPADPSINDGKPALEISLRIGRFYRVFHFNTLETSHYGY